MPRFHRYLCLAFLSAVLTSTLFGAEAPKAPPAPAVDVFKITAPKEEGLSFSYPAKTVSSQAIIVKARTNGLLQKKFFNEGQKVKAGDILYTIEKESYEASYNLAKANAETLHVTMQKAQKEWERVKSLFESGASSEQEKDTAYYAFESAKASYNGAKASLQNAAITLERTTIKAPISGIVGMKMVDVGSLVVDGTSLVEIIQNDPLYVEFSIPDIDVMKQKYNIKNGKWSNPVEGGLKASLTLGDIPYKEQGVVDFLSAKLDEKTGALKARASFKNPIGELLPNQFVKISLLGLTRNIVIKVPQKAVLQNPLGTVVFVVVDDKATTRPVKVGESSGNDFVIDSGLKEGDMVIVNNFFRIKNGAPVKVDKVMNEAH